MTLLFWEDFAVHFSEVKYNTYNLKNENFDAEITFDIITGAANKIVFLKEIRVSWKFFQSPRLLVLEKKLWMIVKKYFFEKTNNHNGNIVWNVPLLLAKQKNTVMSFFLVFLVELFSGIFFFRQKWKPVINPKRG